MADLQELEYRVTRLEEEVVKANERFNGLVNMIADSQQETGYPEGSPDDVPDMDPACQSITDQREGGIELKCPTKEGA